MKAFLLAATLVAGSCSLGMAQGGSSSGGQGTSATPSMAQNPKAGATRDDRMPAKKVSMKKKKKTPSRM